MAKQHNQPYRLEERKNNKFYLIKSIRYMIIKIFCAKIVQLYKNALDNLQQMLHNVFIKGSQRGKP